MEMLYCIIGKSCTGKDTLARELQSALNLRRLVNYTTRPIRPGERDGVDYHFVTLSTLDRLAAEWGVIDRRVYQTVHGSWHYATLRDGAYDKPGSMLAVTTPAVFASYHRAFGQLVKPLYIEIPDRLRLERAIERESRAKNPNYAEVCRRYLADENDFSESELTACGIKTRFDSSSLPVCLAAVMGFIENGK